MNLAMKGDYFGLVSQGMTGLSKLMSGGNTAQQEEEIKRRKTSVTKTFLFDDKRRIKGKIRRETRVSACRFKAILPFIIGNKTPTAAMLDI